MVQIILTHHVAYRLYERGFSIEKIKEVVLKNYKFAKSNLNDIIVLRGTILDGRTLEVVCKASTKNTIIIITAYYYEH